MMVEAGGTEKAVEYYEAGAPKVTEEVLAGGLEAAKTWIGESIDLQLELVKKAGVRAPLAWTPVLDYGDDVFERGRGARRRPARRGRPDRRQGRAQRGHRRRRRRPPRAARGRGQAVRGPRQGGQGGGPLAPEEADPQAGRRGGRPHRRPRPGRPAAGVRRGRRPPDGARLRPVPAGRDPGAQRRAPSACRRWTSCSTPWRPRTRSATCTTTTCRPTPTARPAAWAARSAARSATACSPSGPCCRSSRRWRSSRTRCASSPRCWRPTAPPRWPRSARRRCR